MPLKMGVNAGVSNEEYHADRTYLSSSVLKTINKSALEYKRQYIDGGPGPVFSNRNALDEGSLAHSRILEPHLTATEFNFYPGLRKSGMDYTNWLAGLKNPNLPVIALPQKERVDKLMKVYNKHPVAPQYLINAEREFTLCVELEGVPIKVRFDAVQLEQGIISDVKTTGYGADIDSFKQTLNDLQYDLSAALYCMAAEAHYGRSFSFVFIVLSKLDPAACEVYKTSEATMAKGRRKVMQALSTYKKCKESGIWSDDRPVATESDNYEVREI